jgi:hypothetical protein
MKTNQKIAVFVLSTVLILIIIITSGQSNETCTILEKSELLMPEGISRLLQEKSKYHYVGIEKCASVCHNNEETGFQYNIMKNGPHSRAFGILTSKKALNYARNADLKENPQESSVCLKCHIAYAS